LRILSTLIDESRLEHSVNVSVCARDLALKYGADTGKAELTGLIHDCAKCLTYDKMLELCKKYDLKTDEISKTSRALLHGPLGACLARDLFGIDDDEILSAIACHTTGKKGMNLLDKVVCLADYIEPLRRFDGVEEIRQLAFTDIDLALLKALEISIVHVINSGLLLHPATVEARNELLSLVRDKR